MKHKGDSDTNFRWWARNRFQGLEKGIGRRRNQKKNREHPDYSIVEIGQDIEKSPGDLRTFAVTQTPMKDHQLTMMWKTRKE